jgi:hypothetical protein
MKWSKKDEAKWAKKRMDQMTGHMVNCQEQIQTKPGTKQEPKPTVTRNKKG